ncbi:MAG: DUF531 family protein [Thermoplasmatota archaeon]
MARRTKGNDASSFRDLRRKARKVAEVSELEDILKGISDPYFRAQSHLLIAKYPKEDAHQRIKRALGSADRVDALWRRAELFGELQKLSKDLDPESMRMLLEGIGKRILLLPNGKGLSDALAICPNKLPSEMLPGLLKKSLNNKGFELKDAKNIIRTWSRRLPENGDLVKELLTDVKGIKDRRLRAQLLGYIHLQLERSNIEYHSPMEDAIGLVFGLEGEQKLETFAYLANAASSRWALETLYDGIAGDPGVIDRIKMLSYIASSADRTGNDDLASRYIQEAIEMTEGLENPEKRSGVRLHLAKNLLRMEHRDEALSLMESIRRDTDEKDPVRTFMVKALEKSGLKVPEGWEVPKSSRELGPETKKGPRDVLALYDTYEGAIKEIHLRAIARAAPLCFGFDLDLALIGFPEKDLESLVDRTSKETNIGKGGRYLRELHKQGSIHLVEATAKEPPKDWSKLGYPVATTSRPERKKAVDIRTAKERSGDGRVCLIMGLGRQGLPANLLRSVEAHLELTGKRVPLETATAMGVIAHRLHMFTGEGE